MTSTSAPSTRPSLMSLWEIERGVGPIVAVAVHDGHLVRDSLLPKFAASETERLREEDPFTAAFAAVVPNHIVVKRSRFEVDVNRMPSKAVYLTEQDSWGLRVWREPLVDGDIRKSMQEYRAFYAELRNVLEDVEGRHGKFVVLDLHSYNHRRAGPAACEDPLLNPEVNVGTGTLDRRRWGTVVERFIADLSHCDFFGRSLDVRENVRFQGGHVCRWVHEHFPVTGCALAIEFKKIFMDEWSGRVEPAVLQALVGALGSTLEGLKQAVERC